jgi:hypothetical protein
MSTVNKIILLTIACNMFIFVGVGHGVAPMGLLEPMFFVDTLKYENSLTLVGGYSVRVPGCVMLSMLGQFCLLTACISNRPVKFYLTYTGIAILSLALLFLTIDLSSGRSDTFTLVFAIPFIYASIRLILSLVKIKKERLSENYSP